MNEEPKTWFKMVGDGESFHLIFFFVSKSKLNKYTTNYTFQSKTLIPIIPVDDRLTSESSQLSFLLTRKAKQKIKQRKVDKIVSQMQIFR
jgi:hypothetical protein